MGVDSIGALVPRPRGRFSVTIVEQAVDVVEEVKAVLGEVLSLGDRADHLTGDTALLGNIPEFDSMAVVSVLTSIEERFGIVIDDDEITAEVFETVGTLTRFVEDKLGETRA